MVLESKSPGLTIYINSSFIRPLT
uniref:Uncharacterized protein n=1 Tax=Tetranychus urticae TaxID=32264 RepID=T1K5F7_TETUR